MRSNQLTLIVFFLLVEGILYALSNGYGWKLLGVADLLLYVFGVGVLGWFVFVAVGRKLWRARRIRGFREARELREAALRNSRHQGRH